MSGKIDRNTYLTANIGDFPDEIVVCNKKFTRINRMVIGLKSERAWCVSCNFNRNVQT